MCNDNVEDQQPFYSRSHFQLPIPLDQDAISPNEQPLNLCRTITLEVPLQATENE